MRTTGSIVAIFSDCNIVQFVRRRPRRTAGKSAAITAFPPRQHAIWVIPGCDDPLIVLAGSHGWVHGSRHSALVDAEGLADNFGRPIREKT